jgi:hypothetical protein
MSGLPSFEELITKVKHQLTPFLTNVDLDNLLKEIDKTQFSAEMSLLLLRIMILLDKLEKENGCNLFDIVQAQLTLAQAVQEDLWMTHPEDDRSTTKYYLVTISSNGDWNQHNESCWFAATTIGKYLGSSHNGSHGGYFTNGIGMTEEEIMANPILANVFLSRSRKTNIRPDHDISCLIGITPNP